MIVSCETVVLPSTERAGSTDMLNRMVNDGLPGFVIRSAANRLEELHKELEIPFREAGFVIPPLEHQYLYGPFRQGWRMQDIPDDIRKRMDDLPPATHGVRKTDAGIHVDEFPKPHGPSVSTAKIHLVELGKVSTDFLELTGDDSYNEIFHGTQSGTNAVHDKRLTKNKVDSRLFKAVRYTAEADETDAIVFRGEGREVLAHRFISSALPRQSRIVHVPFNPVMARRLALPRITFA